MDFKERTFIMVKPDGVQRGLVGETIKRFENRGYKLVAMKFMKASPELLKKHYGELATKPFFEGLCKYMSSGPVVPMVWEGYKVNYFLMISFRLRDPSFCFCVLTIPQHWPCSGLAALI